MEVDPGVIPGAIMCLKQTSLRMRWGLFAEKDVDNRSSQNYNAYMSYKIYMNFFRKCLFLSRYAADT